MKRAPGAHTTAASACFTSHARRQPPPRKPRAMPTTRTNPDLSSSSGSTCFAVTFRRRSTPRQSQGPPPLATPSHPRSRIRLKSAGHHTGGGGGGGCGESRAIWGDWLGEWLRRGWGEKWGRGGGNRQAFAHLNLLVSELAQRQPGNGRELKNCTFKSSALRLAHRRPVLLLLLRRHHLGIEVNSR